MMIRRSQQPQPRPIFTWYCAEKGRWLSLLYDDDDDGEDELDDNHHHQHVPEVDAQKKQRDSNWRHQLRLVPEHLVVRSLRRRLWQALVQEDGVKALRCYKATRADWEYMMIMERDARRRGIHRNVSSYTTKVDHKHATPLEQQQKQQLQLPPKKMSVSWRDFRHRAKASNSVSSTTTCNIHTNKNKNNKQPQTLANMAAATNTTAASGKTMKKPKEQMKPEASGGKQEESSPPSLSPSIGLLQLFMCPTDPFDPDDYEDPYAIYHTYDPEKSVATLEREKQQHRHRMGGGRSFIRRNPTQSESRIHAFGFWGARKVLQQHHRGHASSDDQRTAVSLISPTTSQDYHGDHEDHLHHQGNTTFITSDDDLGTYVSTPLHEAARLANAELVRCMLTHPNCDCNIRNGMGRTVLHCVAGGFTNSEIEYFSERITAYIGNSEESSLYSVTMPEQLGIRAPKTPAQLAEEDNNNQDTPRRTESLSFIGRLFTGSGGRSSSKHKKHADKKRDPKGTSRSMICSVAREEQGPHQLELDRIDTAMAMISGSAAAASAATATESMAVVSINAVDKISGRTALHYAAELGRTELCEMILNSYFGAMLTVVDSTGRTPCELAAATGFHRLAAMLEARALLYVDPYGADEELLLAVNADGQNAVGCIHAPFTWFQTLDTTGVQQDRENQVSEALEKMKKELSKHQLRNHIQTSIREYTEQKSAIEEKENCKKKADPPPMNCTMTLVRVQEGDSDKKEEREQGKDENLDEHHEDEDRKLSTKQENDEADDVVNITEVTKVSTSSKATEECEMTEFLHETLVEKYLAYHHFDLESSIEKFKDNPIQSLEEAGVVMPKSSKAASLPAGEKICLICYETMDPSSENWKGLVGCEHSFCIDCMGEYLADCAQSRFSGITIQCPHHECNSLLTLAEIKEFAPNRDVYRKLLNAANDNFIVSSYEYRFCPHPGCCMAVKFNRAAGISASTLSEESPLLLVGAVCTGIESTQQTSSSSAELKSKTFKTYEGLRDPNYYGLYTQPRKSHRFCFQCGESYSHWPVRCQKLQEWKTTMVEEIGEVENDKSGAESFNDVAQKLWLKANTRPCPKCKAPIQKNEGCNHMTCLNPHCKYEFCWICRKDWKLHSSETGGFFRCNVWIEQQEQHEFYDKPPNSEQVASALEHTLDDMNDVWTMESTYGTALHESRAARAQSRKMARFLHHYQRWTAHLDSARLEQKMQATVCERLAPVIREAIDFNGNDNVFGGKGLSFVHAAFIELMECRSMLQHSYAFSFLRYKSTSALKYKMLRKHINEKIKFEKLQSELELMTEQISDVVARSHIRATQNQIMFLTIAACEKRREFSNMMLSILGSEKMEELEAKKNAESVSENNNGRSRGVLGDEMVVGLARPDPPGSVSGSDVAPEENLLAPPPPPPPPPPMNEPTEEDEAIRESLEAFLDSVSGDGGLDSYGNTEHDWACAACTYVNTGGWHCVICGTRR